MTPGDLTRKQEQNQNHLHAQEEGPAQFFVEMHDKEVRKRQSKHLAESNSVLIESDSDSSNSQSGNGENNTIRRKMIQATLCAAKDAKRKLQKE